MRLVKPTTARTARLKQKLAMADSPEAASRIFDDFLNTGPSTAEIELGSIYFGWTAFELNITKEKIDALYG